MCEDHNISARNIVEQVKTLDLQGFALICFQEVTDTSSLETLLEPLGFMFVGRTETKFLRNVRGEYLSKHGLPGSTEVCTCLFVRWVLRIANGSRIGRSAPPVLPTLIVAIVTTVS